MPLPKPNKGESKDDFVSRFMSNETAKEDFPDNKQRVAVALSTWTDLKESKTYKDFTQELNEMALDPNNLQTLKDVGLKKKFSMNSNKFLDLAKKEKWNILNSYKTAFGDEVIELMKLASGGITIHVEAGAKDEKGPVEINRVFLVKMGKIIKDLK